MKKLLLGVVLASALLAGQAGATTSPVDCGWYKGQVSNGRTFVHTWSRSEAGSSLHQSRYLERRLLLGLVARANDGAPRRRVSELTLSQVV